MRELFLPALKIRGFQFFHLMIMCQIFSGCNINYKVPFKYDFARNLNEKNVSDAILENESIDFIRITPNYPVTVGEGIYPNNNQYELEKLISVQRNTKDFTLDVDYRFTKRDSLLKVMLYEWRCNAVAGLSVEQRKMRKLYLNLSRNLSRELGQPTKVENINNVWKFQNGSGFRVSKLWTSKEDFNAYLFMLGNDENGYYRIRLSIYQK